MKNDKVQTQIRLPENLYSEIKQEAKEFGVSANSHLIELLWIGLKARNNFSVIPISENQSDHE